MKKSNRILALVLALVMALSLVGCGGTETSAPAEGGEETPSAAPVIIRFSSMNPAEDNKNAVVTQAWINHIEKETNGGIKFETYYNNTACEAEDQLEAARTGIVDIGDAFSAFWGDNFTLWELFNLPFQYDFPDGYAFSHATAQMITEFPEFIEQVEAQGVHFILLHGDGVGQTYTNKPIYTIDDVKGKIINAGSVSDKKMLEMFGASTEMLGPMDVYDNVSKGVIDGFDQCYTGSFCTGAIDGAKYATELNGAHQGWFYVMNNDTYNSLPDEYKKYFDFDQTKEFMYLLGYQFAQDEIYYRDQIEQSGRVTIIKPTDEEYARFQEAAKPMVQDWIDTVTAAGYDGQAMYDRWVELLDEYATPDFTGCRDRLTSLGVAIPDGWKD